MNTHKYCQNSSDSVLFILKKFREFTILCDNLFKIELLLKIDF